VRRRIGVHHTMQRGLVLPNSASARKPLGCRKGD